MDVAEEKVRTNSKQRAELYLGLTCLYGCMKRCMVLLGDFSQMKSTLATKHIYLLAEFVIQFLSFFNIGVTIQ